MSSASRRAPGDDQRGNGVQAVEQEMRVHLQPERGQLGLLGAEQRRGQLLALINRASPPEDDLEQGIVEPEHQQVGEERIVEARKVGQLSRPVRLVEDGDIVGEGEVRRHLDGADDDDPRNHSGNPHRQRPIVGPAVNREQHKAERDRHQHGRALDRSAGPAFARMPREQDG